MATEAQFAANQENAKHSTGPQTEAGKQTSAANSTKFGLFSTSNCVQPHEREEYDDLCAGLFGELRPVGNIEGMLATEVVRSAWRLRRCANAERQLVLWNRQEENKDRKKKGDSEVKLADPTLYGYSAAPQSAIDRARSSAQNGLRRAMADLGIRQTERLMRARMLPSDVDPATLGLGSVRQILAVPDAKLQEQQVAAKAESDAFVNNLMRQFQEDDIRIAECLRQMQTEEGHAATGRVSSGAPNDEITERSQFNKTSTPRNAQCPCGSGLKYKRCCGTNAPAVLTMAA